MNARSEYVADIDARIVLAARVTFVKRFTNRYGYTYLVKLRDDGGHCLSTFYTGRKWLPEVGQQFEIAATVKAHARWNAMAITELDHVKVISLTGGPAIKRPPSLNKTETAPWTNPAFKRSNPSKQPGKMDLTIPMQGGLNFWPTSEMMTCPQTPAKFPTSMPTSTALSLARTPR